MDFAFVTPAKWVLLGYVLPILIVNEDLRLLVYGMLQHFFIAQAHSLHKNCQQLHDWSSGSGNPRLLAYPSCLKLYI